VYFAAGGINDLMEWFNANTNPEKMLCLLVPKNPEDGQLLRDLFDARGLISPQLKEVALCLFSSRATMNDLRARTPESADYLFVPGLVDARNMPKDWRNWRRVDPAKAEMIPAEVRDEVLLRSQAIANEIIDYFQLDGTDLPCLIFVVRDDLTPFVIRTRGGANLATLRSLFEDLDRAAELVNRSGMLSLPVLIARRQDLMQRRTALEASLQDHHGAATRALEAAADASLPFGLNEAIREIAPGSARDLFRCLGLPHQDKRPMHVRPETRAAAAAALLDPTAHAAFREAVRAGKRLRKIEVELEALDREAHRIDGELDRNSLLRNLNTVEDEINALCTKYERKFRRARHYMTLRRFVLALTGAAKAVENVTTSIGSTVDSIVKELPSASD